MDVTETDIDRYLAELPVERRKTLEGLRKLIREVAPGVAESISYGVPTFKYRGRPLIYMGSAKKHLAIYGGSIGTTRFQPGEPPAAAEVERLLRGRMSEIDEALERKRGGKTPGLPGAAAIYRSGLSHTEAIRLTATDVGASSGTPR